MRGLVLISERLRAPVEILTAAKPTPPAPCSDARVCAGLILLVWAVLFAIRLLGPQDILDQDQERPASYVLDALRNGNWICQRDWTGDVTSKPPMWTWLAALGALPFGRVNLFALYWPGAAAALGSALLVYFYGRTNFGNRAALIGAFACLLTPAAAKQVGLARTDGVFAFSVTLCAFLAFRTWQTGRGWLWVWLAAAASTLTKGPVGPALAAFGLLAVPWERKSGSPQPLRGSQWPGILAFLAAVGGWFLLAYWQLGGDLLTKMLGKELVGHAVQSGKGDLPGTMIYKQPLYYLGRAAPWSLLAFLGLWRIWRHPAPRDAERRLERFLFAWFTCGLLLFSLAPHQRADLLWPIMPAGALIAGRELHRLAWRCSRSKFAWSFAALCALGLAGIGLHYTMRQERAPFVKQTQALKVLAHTIERQGGPEFPLSYVDAPMTLQVYLNTLRPPISPALAAELLTGSEPAFVAVNDTVPIWTSVGSDAGARRLLETPAWVRKKSVVILSNRETLQLDGTFAFGFGNCIIRAHHMKLRSASEREFHFAPLVPEGTVRVSNQGQLPARVRVRFADNDRQERALSPGESLVFQPFPD